MFIRRLFPLPALLAMLGSLCLLTACAPESEAGPVVFAAASLQGAMEDQAQAWTAQGHPRPVLSFAATPALARQVQGGAPADLFLSADQEWIDWLDERRLLEPGSTTGLLGNKLVLVAREQRAAPLALKDLPAALGEERLALADPGSVPAGRYARAALAAAGIWDALESRVVPSENVRAALALVERGEAPFGIVYRSDLKASVLVHEAGTIPDAIQPDIVYPMAQLAGSRHPDAAAFAEFLRSEAAAQIFAAHGFTVLDR